MLADPARPFDTGIAADRAAGFVVVYAPHARDFVAVEPVTHMTDAFNRAERGETGTGTPDSCGRSGIFLYDANLHPLALMTSPASPGALRCVLDVKASLGECPIWSAAEQVLYWVDINAPSLNRFDPATGQNTVMPMPESIGCFALRRAGGFVVALRGGFWLAHGTAR